MGHLIPGNPLGHMASPRVMAWVELILSTPVVLWAGWPLFVRGWQSVVNRSLNMFTLIAMGVGVAYLYSVVATIAPGIFPTSFRDASGKVGLYFEAAAVITALVLLGQVLELRARSQTSSAIRRSWASHPRRRGSSATMAREEDVPLEQVQVGQTPARSSRREGAGGRHDPRRHKRGGRVDDDRRVDSGRESTGRQGDRRHGQRHGQLHHAGREDRRRDTLLAQIVQMVSEAQRSRAPIQRLGRQGCRVVRSRRHRRRGVLTFVVWAVFGPQPALAYAVVNAVAVLIIACPCALGLGHADVDHGRRRPRRQRRCAHQERRGAGDHGEGGHAGRRQDRHAHRGQAAPRFGRAASGTRRSVHCCAWRPASNAAASIRWPRPSSPALRRGTSNLTDSAELSIAHRPGHHGNGGRPPRRARQPQAA